MDDVIQHIDHIFVHNDLFATCLRSLVYRWNHLSILYFYGETTPFSMFFSVSFVYVSV